MDDNLEIAIQLRKQGQFEESRNVLHALIDAKQERLRNLKFSITPESEFIQSSLHHCIG